MNTKPTPTPTLLAVLAEETFCPYCNGCYTGDSGADDCPLCHGTNRVSVTAFEAPPTTKP